MGGFGGSTTTGGSFTGVMFIVTLALSVPPRPSDTVYWKSTTPLKSLLGVKVSVPSVLRLSTPSFRATGVPTAMVWPLTATMSSASPSGSVSLERGSKVSGASSKPVTTLSSAFGGSFTLSTTMLTVAMSRAVPSVTV